jgi:hypothetical protein
MEYLWMIIGDQAGPYFGFRFRLGWATERGSYCIWPACVDWGPSVGVNGSQVTDLLSWAQTCLWEREDLVLSCHGLRLFLDRLLGVGIRWRSKHHTETRSQVLGAWSPSLDRVLETLTGMEWVGLVCARGIDEACVPGYQLGYIDSQIAIFGTVTTCLWSSTVEELELERR